MTVLVRPLDILGDRAGVEAIDTSFRTACVFEVVVSARSIELVERELEQPVTKRYSIDEVFASWRRWDQGWVASEDGRILGFATVGYEEWHRRLNLWFLYVAPDARGRGIGRELVGRAERHALSLGASHVWLETSDVNVPGVRMYEKLGYRLIGADTFYYEAYMPGEAALYLAKRI